VQLQERILALSDGRLLALTLDNGLLSEHPSRQIGQAYAYLSSTAGRSDRFELVTEPLPADPKKAELTESRLLPRQAWALDGNRVLLGYQRVLQARWYRIVDIEAARETDRFEIPDLLPALSGLDTPATITKGLFDPLTSKTCILCARGDLLLVDAAPGRKLLQRTSQGWKRVGDISNRYTTHGEAAAVADGFALELQPEIDEHYLVHIDATGNETARWPRKKKFIVTLCGTTPPSQVCAFGHLGGEAFVADSRTRELDAIPPLLGLGKEDLATPRLSPSARFVATFKHYGGNRISLFDRELRLAATLPLPSKGTKRSGNTGERPSTLWPDVHLDADGVVALSGGTLTHTPFTALSWAPPPPPPPKFKKLGSPLETIEAATLSGPLAPVATLVRGLYAASVALTPSAQKRDLPVGQSKFNGLPDLAVGAEWPRWRGVPMAFMAQIDLAEARAAAPELALPESGLLSFFVGLDPTCPLPSFYGEVNEDRDGARVMWTPAGTPLVRLALPKDMPCGLDASAQPVCKIKFARSGPALPELSHSALAGGALTPEQAIAYEALADLVNGKYDDTKRWGTRLGGYPALLQNDDLHLEAESRQEGAGVIDSEKYALWQQPEFQNSSLRWLQLLQMDEGAQGWGWGDAGLMHWMVQRDEFTSASFSTVWSIGVCH
jgi:uncharacterized protein YwqG